MPNNEGKQKLLFCFVIQKLGLVFSKPPIKMDASARNSYHVRSNSLPSKPHPIVDQVDEHLCRLRNSEATSSSSSSSSEQSHRLSGLQDLNDCIDKLLLLPLTQQALVQESDKKWFDDLLDGSVRLLDLCETTKDALLRTKECVHELGSVLRRRKGGETLIASELQKCLSSRMMIKKTVSKALKAIERKHYEKTQGSPAIVGLLKQVETVSFDVVKSLLSFIAGPKLPSNLSRWSLVSKLMQPKRVACEVEESSSNEVGMVDAALYSMASQNKSKSDVQVEDLQNSLKKLGSTIQEVEDDLEGLYMRLIKSRVSLLNILNH